MWEALVTLCYFPVCVILAWIADRRLLFYKYMAKRYRADKRTGVVVETEGDMTPKGTDMIMDGKFPCGSSAEVMSTEYCQDRANNSAGAMATLLNSNSATINVESTKELNESRKEVRRNAYTHYTHLIMYTHHMVHSKFTAKVAAYKLLLTYLKTLFADKKRKKRFYAVNLPLLLTFNLSFSLSLPPHLSSVSLGDPYPERLKAEVSR